MTRYRKSWTEVVEEVRLFEALKPKDKKIIDAFYDKKLMDSDYLSTNGNELYKMGIGGQPIALWTKGKIEIVAKSDVKSTEEILRYMKKSIPKLNFDPKSYKKYFGEEIDEKVDMDKAGYGGSRHKKIEKDKYNKKRKGQGIEDEFGLDESAVLQLKMAFDDAGIKIKGVKGGKLVIAKKDKKKVEGIISKQMKKPADAKKVLGSQIVFEDKGSVLTNYPFDQGGAGEEEEESKLAEKGTAYPATIDTLRMIVKDKQHQTVMFKSGSAMVDLFTASAMVQVYDALKPALKKTFEKMIADKGGFMKTQAFAMKMLG